MQRITVHNKTSDRLIGDRIQCATTTWTRLIGLLKHVSLEAGEGLWISPSSGVHTFGMRFAIDVVGLDRELRVVRLWSGLQPYRMTMVNTQVRSILELAEGQIVRQSVRLGDEIQLKGVNQDRQWR